MPKRRRTRAQNQASYIAAELRQLTGPAAQRGGTIADCRKRRAAALLGVRQGMDERLGLFPGGQQTAARTSSKVGAAASRSDSTGGAH